MSASQQEPKKIESVLKVESTAGHPGTTGETASPKIDEANATDRAGPDGQMAAQHAMSMAAQHGMSAALDQMYPQMYASMYHPMYPMYPPGPWFMSPMAMMQPAPYYYGPNGKGSSKGWKTWGGCRGGSQGGGKGGAGRGQRGPPGGGNSSGNGQHYQQEMLPQSTLQMDPQWKQNWEEKLKCHARRDTDDHTTDLQALLGELQGHVWEASIHKDGCIVVQLAMTHCRAKDWPLLLKELHGKVWEAVEHPQANFVLQTIIEAANRSSCRFIIEECLDKAVELAKHRYGCRILCRISEHCLGEDNAMLLIQRVLEDPKVVASLCCHNFGHHVVQQIIEKGGSEHRKIIVDVLSTDLIKMAQSRHASYIIEAAFDFCEEEDKKKLKNILLQEGCIIELCKNLFGGFVVKKLAGREEEEDEDEQDEDGDDGGEQAFKKDTQNEIQKLLREHETELRDDKNGKKVWEDVFPAEDGEDRPEQKDEDEGSP